jgi:Ni/Co efflux regulator RcnB
MNTSKKTLVAALLATMALAPAFADKGGNGKGGGKHDRVERVERHHDRHDDDRFDRDGRDGRRHDGDRVVILDRHHGAGCPPGLAKKHNGCMPPGQAKKADRVIIGQALPPGAVFTVPRRTLSTLPPPPLGYRYAVVNNQVVLVGNNNIVVDIILRSLLG